MKRSDTTAAWLEVVRLVEILRPEETALATWIKSRLPKRPVKATFEKINSWERKQTWIYLPDHYWWVIDRLTVGQNLPRPTANLRPCPCKCGLYADGDSELGYVSGHDQKLTAEEKATHKAQVAAERTQRARVAGMLEQRQYHANEKARVEQELVELGFDLGFLPGPIESQPVFGPEGILTIPETIRR